MCVHLALKRDRLQKAVPCSRIDEADDDSRTGRFLQGGVSFFGFVGAKAAKLASNVAKPGKQVGSSPN